MSDAGYSTVDEQNAELEQLFDDVVKEIEDRQKYLEELSSMGAENPKVEKKVYGAILIFFS